jgi:hypothetical protein
MNDVVLVKDEPAENLDNQQVSRRNDGNSQHVQVGMDSDPAVAHNIESKTEEDESEIKATAVSKIPVIGIDQGTDDMTSMNRIPPSIEVQETKYSHIVPPLSRESSGDVHMITVILRPHEDRARDKLLLRRIFGIMISIPGNDRFAFHIFERGRGHLLEFPNLTTGLCPELIGQIDDLVGTENVRIEVIKFQ